MQRTLISLSSFLVFVQVIFWPSYSMFEQLPAPSFPHFTAHRESPEEKDCYTEKQMGGVVSKVDAKAVLRASAVAATERKPRKKPSEFRMPLDYPRYSRADYEAMPEWKLDLLLAEYGLPVYGSLEEKRRFAMGAFLWS